jgi:hypothetical protein
MKGYPTILKRSQTRLLKRYRSKTYLNACWVPVFQGSKEYVLDGDEVKRGLKSIYRIVWNISHRNAVGKVQKKQTHIASIQHWNVVDEFKEFLQYRQGRIENDSIMWTKANIPGNVPDLKNVIAEFLEDLGSDISIDGQIYDAIEKKLANVGDSESSDTANFISKINLKWYPVKKLIITDYVGSEEFQVWLSNEAMRKAGPRKSTKQELRDQKEFEGKFDSFKVRIPGHSGHPFRTILATDSEGSRPPIPIDCGHQFRLIAATDSRVSRPPIPNDPGHCFSLFGQRHWFIDLQQV